ncbi:MAG TPA: hypothetical protein VHF92_12320 [Geodermatophilus sp.]|nr:hypothetical protein [Geodermatophilus sp.]
MILAAGLLVLLGLGLFVGGVATGSTALYWACVAACAGAAVLLVAVRLRPRPTAASPADRAPAEAPASEPAAGMPAAVEPPVAEAPVGEPAAPAHRPDDPPRAPAPPAADAGPVGDGDPPEEDVEMTDLLLVVDLREEVLVVDEHPRYHLAGCRYLTGRTTIPLPLAEARADGFTPCGACAPDRHLADAERARKATRTG